MFSASFDGTDIVVAQGLLRKGPAAILAIVNRVNVLAIKLQSHIVADKLSGQVLKHRSGKLAASVRVIPAQNNQTTIYADVNAAGGPAFYGRIHEYGGDRPYVIVPTNKKALRFVVGNQVVFARRVNHPPLPERSFMRSSLKDMQEAITAGLQQAISEGIDS